VLVMEYRRDEMDRKGFVGEIGNMRNEMGVYEVKDKCRCWRNDLVDGK